MTAMFTQYAHSFLVTSRRIMTKPYQIQANQSIDDRCRLNLRVYPTFNIWHKLFVSHASGIGKRDNYKGTFVEHLAYL